MKLELSNKSLACLLSVLALPNWVKSDDAPTSIKRAYWANKLIAHAPTAKLEATTQEEVDKWAKKKAKAFEINAYQVELCKLAISDAVKAGIVNNGDHLSELFEVFKLYEEEKA